MGESRKQDVVINSVKGGGEIEQDKSRDFAFVKGEKKVVLNPKKGGFSGVEFPVRGLKRGKGRKGMKMVGETGVNDTFDDFRDEV